MLYEFDNEGNPVWYISIGNIIPNPEEAWQDFHDVVQSAGGTVGYLVYVAM